jgi:hypothetical protein
MVPTCPPLQNPLVDRLTLYTHLCLVFVSATGFLLSMSINDQDEKSLMCFQRKPNDRTVSLDAEGNNLLNNHNLVRKRGELCPIQ